MKRSLLLASLCASLACSAGALAQSKLDHPVGQMLPYIYDTGTTDNPVQKLVLADAFQVHMQNAVWLRVYFDVASLPAGSYVQLTSILDGETQRLDADAMAMWSNGSAYFNGDTVVVEVFAGPGTVGTRVKIKEIASEIAAIQVGDPGQCGICGVDDRFQTAERWSGRIMPVGCTGSMYCNGDGMITAGHCVSGGNANVIQFNVPNSGGNCGTVNPPVDDQFPVLAGYQFQNAGVGADWAACRVGTNGLGQNPVQRYGVFRPLAGGPSGNGAPTNMWGYGLDTNCVKSQTQQNSAGNITGVAANYYTYNNDVRGGNSGSGYLNAANQIIGVVTHCSVGCPNYATRIDLPAFVAARAAVGCQAPPAPANDNCGSAANLGLGSLDGTTTGATNDGVGSCRSTSLSPDVWYRFTPACTGTYRFATCGGTTNFDTVVSVHSGCPGNAANTLACNDDFCNPSGLASQVDAALTAGTTYLIRVGGFNTASGNFTLTSSAVATDAPPANDACAAATPIGLGSIDGTNFCATNDGATSCGFQSSFDVWYSFTPTCSGTYIFDTCGGPAFDAVLSVHTGCPGGTANQVACDDDGCGYPWSRVSAAMTGGTNYKIRVAGYFGARGNFTLNISRGADTFPANDSCGNATPVGLGTVFGSTVCATNDGSASCALSATSADVWYVFTPDCTAFYVADTAGDTNYDSALSVHTGCPGTTANQVACDDDGAGNLRSRAVWQATAGVAYYIRVNGFNNNAGNFQLNIGNLPNDACANPIQVFDGTVGYSNRGATTDGSPAGICLDVANNQQVNSDVWFYYFATCEGTVDVNTCGGGYDTKMAVYLYEGTLCPQTAPIGCNDDMGGACSVSGLRSQVTFAAVPGQIFLIRVGGYQAAQGCGVLNVACTPSSSCAQCAADFNQDGGIDGSDVGAFFDTWEAGAPCGDVNQDGGIDGSDVDFFFSVWEQGGCDG